MSHFEDLININLSQYTLILGDCIVTPLQEHYKDRTSTDIVIKQAQGGNGWDIDYPALSDAKKYILVNSWANAASVIDDVSAWTDRIDNQKRIIKGIASTGKPFLIVDRPGVLDRYIDREFRLTIDENPKELGMPYELAIANGWSPPDLSQQNNRRKKYHDIITNIIGDSQTVYYFDLQSLLTSSQICEMSCEIHHRGGVVNEAPWHLNQPFNYIICDMCDTFIDKSDLPQFEIDQIISKYIK